MKDTNNSKMLNIHPNFAWEREREMNNVISGVVRKEERLKMKWKAGV